MAALTPAARARASRRVRPRTAPPLWAWLWIVVGAVYFLVPLLATAQFSLETARNQYGLGWYAQILGDPQFHSSFLLSLGLALGTAVVSLVLMVPTVFWCALKVPRMRPVMELIAVLPFVIPPVALAVGLASFLHPLGWLLSTPWVLILPYVIMALPFTYRSLDAGMRALDLTTLYEASQSLGASSGRTLLGVVLPNLRTAIVSATLLTVAVVMGEYTISSLLLYNTFAVYIQYIGNTKAYPAAALTIISFGLTWAAMLVLFFVGRGARGRGAVAITK